MTDSGGREGASVVEDRLEAKGGSLKNIKIGAVARHFGVSVDLLRLYEREGLLIPLKSAKGTRYFTERDYPWIATVLRLVREARLNFAGIRHLLALLPCWEIRQCKSGRKQDCTTGSASAPCWMNQSCCKPGDCYVCEVYRAACQCENLKAFVSGKVSEVSKFQGFTG